MLPRPEDNLLGKIAVAFGFVTPEQLEECVRLQKETEPTPLLGTLLQDKGYLKRDELRDLLEFQKEKLQSADSRKIERETDRMFGYLAVQMGLLTDKEVLGAVEEQALYARRGLRFRLGEILISNKLLTAEQVDDVLKGQHRYLVICQVCERRHVTFNREPGEKFLCDCGRELEVPGS